MNIELQVERLYRAFWLVVKLVLNNTSHWLKQITWFILANSKRCLLQGYYKSKDFIEIYRALLTKSEHYWAQLDKISKRFICEYWSEKDFEKYMEEKDSSLVKIEPFDL